MDVILQTFRNQSPGGKPNGLLEATTPTGATALMLAAGQGNDAVIEILLRNGANVNALASTQETALDFAAHAGYAQICESLIHHGASIETSKVFSRLYASQKAATGTNPEIPSLIKQVERQNTNLSVAGDAKTGWTDIMHAAFSGLSEEIQTLANSGADIETVTPDGQTALMIAAAGGRNTAVEALLALGANINAVNAKGWTALMLATQRNDLTTVQLLLVHGADVNHLSSDRWTALAEASQHGFHDIMAALLDCGADMETKSSHDWTPLNHACYAGDVKGVQLLVGAGADIENGSMRDATPMLLAASSGNIEVCKILFEHGAYPESAWARRKDTKETVESADVESGGVIIERAYKLGWTPLMVACQSDHEPIVRLLLGKGANVEPRSPTGFTAMEIALKSGRNAIAKILEEYDCETQSKK